MITIQYDEAALRGALAKIEQQVQYASAVALTKTAQDAQGELRRRLPERFTIRTPWVAKGITIIPATKKNLESVVLDKDAFMTMQETGGTKTGAFGKSLSIPVGARPTPKSITRPSQFPGALMKQKRYFIAPLVAGDKRKFALWQRLMLKNKHPRTGRMRYPIRVMYIFDKRVKIQPRFRFAETISDVASRVWQGRFDEALQMAMRTAR